MSLPEPLTPAGAEALEAILRSPAETLIATDFDGTLAPIVDDPEQAYADLADPLADLAVQYGLVLSPGKNVWEIRTAGMDKRAALHAIVEEMSVRQVIFAGDDLGDLRAFQAVRDLVTAGMAGLLVCSASTEEDALTELSDVIVDGSGGLAVWLNELANQLGVDSA
jgi:trehalose 6-phosphate phosphatase